MQRRTAQRCGFQYLHEKFECLSNVLSNAATAWNANNLDPQATRRKRRWDSNPLIPPLDQIATKVKQQNQSTMTCAELAQHIQSVQPRATLQDVARLCLLLSNSVDEISALRDTRVLQDAWKRTGLQLQVATDQHAAMTEELEQLAASNPENFTKDQIWILIRAIKVQSQVLQMYVGHPLLDV